VANVEVVTPVPASTVLSRHASGQRYRWTVEAQHANAWCRIPGSPFARGFVLFPNPPDLPAVTVRFGPFELPVGVDTFTVLAVSDPPVEHRNTLGLEVALVDGSSSTLARSVSRLGYGEGARVSLSIDAPPTDGVRLSFGVSFEEFADPFHYGSVEIRYVLGYGRNPLCDFFNAAGSDKGTDIHSGDGFPHCYALDYYGLFAPFREETFKLLEIGLQNRGADRHAPTDAPSLRGWRAFFPNATVYGFDIEDFSFLTLDDTFTFQGNQSSRDDLERFLASSGRPQFRLIVDDGSHVPSHQQISLARLFPYLEPGGMYVIEDLGWQPYPESPRTSEVLRGYIRGSGIGSPFLTDAEAHYLATNIDRVEMFKPNDSEFALIRKSESP